MNQKYIMHWRSTSCFLFWTCILYNRHTGVPQPISIPLIVGSQQEVASATDCGIWLTTATGTTTALFSNWNSGLNCTLIFYELNWYHTNPRIPTIFYKVLYLDIFIAEMHVTYKWEGGKMYLCICHICILHVPDKVSPQNRIMPSGPAVPTISLNMSIHNKRPF